MTYFIVMGSLALSVLFTFGWALWRTVRWLSGSLPGGGRQGGRGKGAARKPARRPAQAKARKPAATPVKKPSVKARREPSRLTQWMAEWRATLPLAVVTTMIYLVARLVEHGMSYRPPHTVPGGFHSLIVVLGWVAAAMLVLALINRLAAWRCR
ncbi:hypothetical protein [Billgrantia montanilacus]|uniref:Uncharacterized protein n=1 Tax=Billgrantia montanilacus TaxID=2282305 RepID=A0A368TYU1_9GAMM|nr:hypothetical protein [Halomonas montanilacus]RCV89387.1 hypothetical protein DU505_10095 [Halomonas montanilacus]